MFDDDDFFRDPADEQEYEDMAKGLNAAGILALVVLIFAIGIAS